MFLQSPEVTTGYVEGTGDWRAEGKAVQATPQLGGPTGSKSMVWLGESSRLCWRRGTPKPRWPEGKEG